VTHSLTASLLDPATAVAPADWAGFVTDHALPAVWDWRLVYACALDRPGGVLAATIHDGQTVCGLVTARLRGARVGRGRAPLAGVIDVECLVSPSLPGVVLAPGAHPTAFGDAVVAFRAQVRRVYGRRVGAMLLRRIPAGHLTAVLREPALTRRADPVAVWHNRFTDFDDYLGSLTKNRRRSLRRTIAQFEANPDLIIAFTGRGDPRGRLDEAAMHELQASVVHRHRRHWYQRKRLTSSAVARAALDTPGVHWLTYHDRAGRLVAYGNVSDHHEWPVLGSWGARSQADGGPKHLWFYDMTSYLRWCIENDRQGLIVGRGSIGDKVSMGCELREQWDVLLR
jgi:uncharacterized protein